MTDIEKRLRDSGKLFVFADDPDLIEYRENLKANREFFKELQQPVSTAEFNRLVRESAEKAGLVLSNFTNKEAVPVESKSTTIQVSTPFQAAFDNLLGISHNEESSK